MKKNRIIIPALGLIALGTAASITGTVAWFTANNTVSVNGMTVSTSVQSNLLIASDTLGSTAKVADANFTKGPLTQTITGKILEPVSTVNGKDFFYTTNAKVDGDAVEDDYVAYTTQAAFATAYGLTGDENVQPYVDYVFQLRADNVSGSAQDLKLTTLDLKYSGATDGNKAFRVAVLVQDVTSASITAGFHTTANGIYAPTGFDNQSKVDSKSAAVSAAAAAPTALAVSGAEYNALTKLAEVAANSTKYYKVITRLYIEGEDKTCTNGTFALLNGNWSLTLECALGTGSNVSTLGMSVTA